MANTRTSPAHLGIDLGTGSVKAAVVDESGIVSIASEPYAVHAPQPGWAESDPADWLEATRSVAGRVIEAGGGPQGVGFSGQMHGVVLADENLEPVRPAILAPDTRSAEQAVRLGSEMGAQILSTLGSAPVAGFAATTLAWLIEHEPEAIARARYVLQPKDWLRARLGGDSCTDPSDASGTLMYDVVEGTWSLHVLDWLGIDPQLIPEVRGSAAAAGSIDIAGRSVPAFVGGADTACALAGLGVPEGFIAVGSGSQVVRVLGEPQLDPTLRTHTFATAGAIGEGWYRIGAIMSAGITLTAALGWLGAGIEEANAALEQGVQPTDPLFIPYLSGERTPFMDPGLRGCWVGLSLATDRPAMLRSVLEGVAQAIALGIEAVQASGDRLPSVVPLVGGGTHALAFRQLLADAGGVAVAVADAPNAAVIGAAGLGAGMTRNPYPVGLGAAVEPRAQAYDLLAERRAALIRKVVGGD